MTTVTTLFKQTCFVDESGHSSIYLETESGFFLMFFPMFLQLESLDSHLKHRRDAPVCVQSSEINSFITFLNSFFSLNETQAAIIKIIAKLFMFA